MGTVREAGQATASPGFAPLGGSTKVSESAVDAQSTMPCEEAAELLRLEVRPGMTRTIQDPSRCSDFVVLLQARGHFPHAPERLATINLLAK